MNRRHGCLALIPLLILVPACGGDADSSTPEGLLAELKRTENEGDWRAHFRLHTKESLPSLLLPVGVLPPSDPEMKKRLQELAKKHVPPADPDARNQPLTKEVIESLIQRIPDPETFYAEAMAIIRGGSGRKHRILDFEDLEVDGARATVRQVVEYGGAGSRTDGEPIRLARVDGRWLKTWAK